MSEFFFFFVFVNTEHQALLCSPAGGANSTVMLPTLSVDHAVHATTQLLYLKTLILLLSFVKKKKNLFLCAKIDN